MTRKMLTTSERLFNKTQHIEISIKCATIIHMKLPLQQEFSKAEQHENDLKLYIL